MRSCELGQCCYSSSASAFFARSTLYALLRPIWPAHFDPDAEIECHAGERRIPLGDHAVASPFQCDRLRPIKHGHQGNAAVAGGVSENGSCVNLDP
jgi:hypothetical protein